jgi:hypothetical protein
VVYNFSFDPHSRSQEATALLRTAVIGQARTRSRCERTLTTSEKKGAASEAGAMIAGF